MLDWIFLRENKQRIIRACELQVPWAMCLPYGLHCAQLAFRVPQMVDSPFTLFYPVTQGQV